MQETILEKIVKNKINWIVFRKKKQPLINFKCKLNTNTRDFYTALKQKKPSYILECKKYSPSLGMIRNNFDLIKISNVYKKYASAISVVTDEKHFHGNLKYVNIVRESSNQPILCKDFFIDPYQVYLARYYNADAILLMLSILNDTQYQYLSELSKELNMSVLTEINNISELERALKLKAKIIGINNRNLHDLSINLNRTRTLSLLVKKEDANAIIISESGIKKYRQIKELGKFVDGFLIGSHLMSKKNLEIAVRSIILGKNKICGLTRKNDVEMIEKYGSIYGGFIFSKNSPRNITTKIAKNILIKRILRYVGVFQNEDIKNIINIASELNLYAVQLHGCENQEYINKLRKFLPEKTKIWKACSIQFQMPNLNWKNVDTYIFDSLSGGSNKCFDWSILNNHILDNVILAGGINLENCTKASKLNCLGLDLNSGVELSPGIKDNIKIKLIFKKLRYY